MSGAVIILRQKKIIRSFQEAGAWGPESARSLHETGCRDGWIFRRLVARGVLREDLGGRFHLDRGGLERYRRRLAALRAAAITALVGGVVLLLVF